MEETSSLIRRLEEVWKILWSKGIDREQMIAGSMLSPATCCLVNPDRERTVERAFSSVNQMAAVLRDKYVS
jgi:hypothetical protein